MIKSIIDTPTLLNLEYRKHLHITHTITVVFTVFVTLETSTVVWLSPAVG